MEVALHYNYILEVWLTAGFTYEHFAKLHEYMNYSVKTV
jgi:hypothetical protein